jgi:hypothetical protein
VVEQVLAEFDEGQVGQRHEGEGQEEPAGQRLEASIDASGVAGSTAPIVATPSAASSMGVLGRLRKNGTLATASGRYRCLPASFRLARQTHQQAHDLPHRTRVSEIGITSM